MDFLVKVLGKLWDLGESMNVYSSCTAMNHGSTLLISHIFQYLPLCSQESTNTYTHYMQRKYQMPWALNIWVVLECFDARKASRHSPYIALVSDIVGDFNNFSTTETHDHFRRHKIFSEISKHQEIFGHCNWCTTTTWIHYCLSNSTHFK